MTKVWKSKPFDRDAVERLTQDLNLSPLIARLLATRKIISPTDAIAYLKPEAHPFPDPFLFMEMEAAVSRIERAITSDERILVHGDYDADGVTATATLYEALLELGANVDAFTPNRIDDGYDFRPESAARFAEAYDLLITVDCGATANDAVDAANRLGLDIIITDHHEPGPERPAALAVINPSLPEETYPTKNLSGAGVAWKLACALRQSLCGDCGEERQMDLAALGIVADIMPLTGENRALVTRALQLFGDTDRPGLAALMEIAKVIPTRVTAEDIGFRLGPRLNAAGRLDDPRAAFDLLTTIEEEIAVSLARHLHALNQKRQSVERQIFKEACAAIEQNNLLERSDKLLFVAGDSWHRGVIGIVAAKLSRRYSRPTFLFSLADGIAHGSARAIEGANLSLLLDTLREHSVSCGGHDGAAGMTVLEERMSTLENALYEAAETQWPIIETPPIWVDAQLPLERIDDNLMNELSRLQPFGHGNEEPIFYARARINGYGARVVGNDHLQMSLLHPRGSIKAIGFGMGGKAAFLGGGEVEILYQCRYEEYNGRRDIGLRLIDAKAAKPLESPARVETENSPPTRAPASPNPQTLSPIDSSLDREKLGNVYRVLRNSANESQRLAHTNAYLLGKALKIEPKDFDLALQIFSELELLHISDENIHLLDADRKRNLSDSETYQAIQAFAKTEAST